MKNIKHALFILFFLPLCAWAQKIRINEMDKFIKQRRIESFPLTLASAAQIKMAVALSAEGPSLFLQLTGTGLGANRIDVNDKVIFLLDNDSTVTIRSKGYQSFEIGPTVSSYKHYYVLKRSDLEALVKHNLQALRKYRAEDYDDVHITQAVSVQFRKLCTLFFEELRKTDAPRKLQTINLAEVSNYIGDSVIIVGKISGGRYLPNSKDAVTLLNVGKPYPDELLALVIRGADRKNFEEAPEQYYPGKEVRIIGRVELYNKKPQINITDKNQLEVIGDGPVPINAVVQTKDTVAVRKPEVAPPKPVPIAPGFPGGEGIWVEFLKRNLKPPPELKAGENKTVIVNFLVTADGSINDIKIVQSAGPSFDKEVLRVLKRMPKWKAAIENGRAVDAVVTQSIIFYQKDAVGVL